MNFEFLLFNLNAHLTYTLILLGSIAGPLALSFDKKVAYYKKWSALLPAMIFPAVGYIIWDVYFTAQGIWSFNANYIVGLHLFNLPIEEVMFFFVVPFCCVFIYECIKQYFPTLKDQPVYAILNWIMAFVLLVLAILNFSQRYTFYTFTLNAMFLFALPFIKRKCTFIHIRRMFVSYAVILFPFLLINGLLTAIPVVLYNDIENLGTRIYTIPVEDIFYGMLLIFADIICYEIILHRKSLSKEPPSF